MAKKTLAEKMAENSKTIMQSIKTNTVGSFSSAENIKKNIIILQELKDLIPPLAEIEFAALKENLLKNGCKDPLKVWQTTYKSINLSPNNDEPAYVLIDGHHRFQLCNELQLPFNIQIDNFESINQVRDFMIDFQLSRRNITPQQASYLRGLKYNAIKKDANDNLKANFPNGQNDHSGNLPQKSTAQELGEYFNVGEKTIRRDAEFARGLEKLDTTLRQDVLAGKTKIEKATIQKIGKASQIQEPITSIEEINAVQNTLQPQVNELLHSKFVLLNESLKKVYRTRNANDIEDIKNLFNDFINSLN